MSSEIDVLVIGSCNIDLIAYTKQFPKIGETVHGYKFDIGTGGKGFNQCIAAAKLGAKTGLITKIGNDQFGEKFLEMFEENRVDTTYVQVIDDSTGVAQITVNDSGENIITIIAGANSKLSADDVEKSKLAVRSAKVVLLQFETPLDGTVKALEICEGNGECTTIVNGAPGLEQVPLDILRKSDIFCVNEIEAEITSGISVKNIESAKQAAVAIRNKGCKLPLITLGGEGIVYIPKSKDSPIHIPVDKVAAVDSTGAGDAFLGALAYFICKFPDLEFNEILHRTCEVAKYSVMRIGTSISFPHRENLADELFK